MNNKFISTALAILLFFSIHKAVAFDEDLEEKWWNTASGKTYLLYKNLAWTQEVKDKSKTSPGRLFMISYITQQKLDDKPKLLEEFYDLMTHFYYFYAPENLKNKSAQEKIKYYVLVEALQERPKPGDKNYQTSSFSKNFIGVSRIVELNKNIDKVRLSALLALHKHDYNKAITHFEKIQNKVPHDFVHMGNCYLYMGKRDNAKEKVEAGLKVFSNNLDLLHHLAYITILEGTFITEGKYEYDPQKMSEAKKTLEKILSIKEDDWLAHSNMATVETTLKNYEAAEKILKNLISKSSSPVALKKRLGDLYVLWKGS